MLGKVSGTIGTIPIGCEGATSSLKARYMTDGGVYEIYVNGEKYPKNSLFRSGEFINYLSSNFNVELKPLDSNGNVVIPSGIYYNNVEIGEFINHSSDYVQIQISTIDASSISQILNNNPSAEWNESTQSLSFCLAPKDEGGSTCFSFPQTVLENLPLAGPTFTFNNPNNQFGIILADPEKFYISANDRAVQLISGGGGAIWGTDINSDLYISDADGYLMFGNRTPQELIVRICTKVPIPLTISPIYSAALGSNIEDAVIHRDENGYETCVFKLSRLSI
ncbi:hypothetical protein ACG9XY_12380 [Acinetobacter seifertii]|uniref:hypothetical protein n=1 Tax=Acinetobacter seifertii TaxID=1530123 RepID=UPI002940DBD4|nr:hypothetical protein [Acinetobacter seifertii]MDV4263317.1 hypothetical protein [Acinetobacter seifertii]